MDVPGSYHDFSGDYCAASPAVFPVSEFFRLKLNLPNAVPEFIGFGNYIKMFSDPTLLTSTGNTLLFAVVSVALEVVIGLFLAMALCSDKMWARICTSIFLIPMIMLRWLSVLCGV